MENKTIQIRSNKEDFLRFENLFISSNYKSRNEFLKYLLAREDKISSEIHVSEEINQNINTDKRIKWGLKIREQNKKFILDVYKKSNYKLISDFLIACISNIKIEIKEEKIIAPTVLSELKKIGTNINQIAIRANQLQGVDIEVKDLLNKIYIELLKIAKS